MAFGTALVVFGSYAMQGWFGRRHIGAIERLVLVAAGVACIVPRLDVQLAGAAAGILALLAVRWLKAPEPAAAPARALQS